MPYADDLRRARDQARIRLLDAVDGKSDAVLDDELLDAYVEGRLEPDARVALDDWFIHHPLDRERLDALRAFATPAVAAAASAHQPNVFVRAWRFVTQPVLLFWVPLAAAATFFIYVQRTNQGGTTTTPGTVAPPPGSATLHADSAIAFNDGNAHWRIDTRGVVLDARGVDDETRAFVQSMLVSVLASETPAPPTRGAIPDGRRLSQERRTNPEGHLVPALTRLHMRDVTRARAELEALRPVAPRLVERLLQATPAGR